MSDSRWLKPEATAAYTGIRVDYLRRYVKAGKLPAPSYHLGPRSPRWDRHALDALFQARQADQENYMSSDEVIDGILSGRWSRRQKGAGRRHH